MACEKVLFLVFLAALAIVRNADKVPQSGCLGCHQSVVLQHGVTALEGCSVHSEICRNLPEKVPSDFPSWISPPQPWLSLCPCLESKMMHFLSMEAVGCQCCCSQTCPAWLSSPSQLEHVVSSTLSSGGLESSATSLALLLDVPCTSSCR